MIAIGAKKLLQIIIGAGQVGNVLTMKQTWPVAPADLQKVLHRGREGPGFGLMLPHGSAQPVQSPLHGGPCLLGVIIQDVRGAMDPAIGHTHLGPQGRRRVQPTSQDRPQAP
jgi:hypothetical protein